MKLFYNQFVVSLSITTRVYITCLTTSLRGYSWFKEFLLTQYCISRGLFHGFSSHSHYFVTVNYYEAAQILFFKPVVIRVIISFTGCSIFMFYIHGLFSCFMKAIFPCVSILIRCSFLILFRQTAMNTYSFTKHNLCFTRKDSCLRNGLISM